MSQDNNDEKSAICVRSELYEELMKEAEEKNSILLMSTSRTLLIGI